MTEYKTDAPRGRATRKPDTNAAQERGERVEAGRTIQRGDKSDGQVPGGENHEEAE